MPAKQPDINSPGRVTRHDVARAAGVSLTTVTHALNPTPGSRMSDETRARVRLIARELGYRPNFIGRALVEGKTYTIGLLQPSFDAVFYGFYQRMMYGMVQAMEPDDYHLLALFRSSEHRYLKVITQGRVDGMLVMQSDLDTACITRILETGIPVVVVNKGFPVAGHASVGCVHSDHHGMMQQVVEEFATLGCRSVLQINDFRACDANAQMMEGFTAAMAHFGGAGMVGSTLIPDWQALGQQLRNAFAGGQRWDGIFADSVEIAETVLAEAEAAGLRAGRDFHLISSSTVDGETTRRRLEHSAYTHQPHLLGQEAWRVLRGLLAGETEARAVLVPYRRYGVVGCGPG